jgi:hypothetical protein
LQEVLGCATTSAADYSQSLRQGNSRGLAGVHFKWGGKLPFDKLRANEKACPFALSLSKGEFAPKLK